MKVIYFLIDAFGTDEPYIRQVNQFLNGVYDFVLPTVAKQLSQWEEVRYKFWFLRGYRVEKSLTLTLPDDAVPSELEYLSITEDGAFCSFGSAFQRALEDFLFAEKAQGAPVFFMLVNKNSNSVDPSFQKVYGDLKNSQQVGADRVFKAPRYVFCFDADAEGKKRLEPLWMEKSTDGSCNPLPIFFDDNDVRGESKRRAEDMILYESLPPQVYAVRPQEVPRSSYIPQGGVPLSPYSPREGSRFSYNSSEAPRSPDTPQAGIAESASPASVEEDPTVGERTKERTAEQSVGKAAYESSQEAYSDDEVEMDDRYADLIENPVDLSEADYKQRLVCAKKVLEDLDGPFRSCKGVLDHIKRRGFYKRLPFMRNFKFRHIPSWVSEKETRIVAYLLFYIFSGGNYADVLWRELLEDYSATSIGKVEITFKATKKTIETCCGRRVASGFHDMFKGVLYGQEGAYIHEAMGDLTGVGCAKIFERLYTVFVKDFNYDISGWKEKLNEYESSEYTIRKDPDDDPCVRALQCAGADLFAVSYECKLEKLGHDSCQDYSFVDKYDEDTWLVVVADGVGSCIHSAVGSRQAALSLSSCISEYLTKHGFIDEGGQALSASRSDDDFARLMYYLKFSLAKEFYGLWEQEITSSPTYKNSPKPSVVDFASTMQFAFGCAKFVACGRVGDGNFYVKMKKNAGDDMAAGFVLNDGISGVLRIPVLNVSHLGKAPQALQISFFNADAVSDILIASDGLNLAVGKSIREVDEFVGKLSGLPFDKRCQELDRIAQKCSDYNETDYGIGDDSSVGFIHFNA